MRRRIFALFLVLPVLSMLALPAFAHDVPNTEREDCSITVTVPGGELTAIRVGEVCANDGNCFFIRIPDGMELAEVRSAETAAELERYYRENPENHAFETWTRTADTSGSVSFTGLKTGLYLIVQDVPAEGYSALKPFLVSVPYLEDGEYRYDINASAKLEPEREPEPADPAPSKPSGSLPQTGQRNWPIPALTAAGLLVFLLGWLLRFRGKQGNDAQ